MKTKKSVVLLVTVLELLVLFGCTQRLIDFTIISSKNVDISNAAKFIRGTERIEGEDTVYIIIFIPTGIPNMKEACDRALEKVPGAVALVDGVISYKSWWFIFGVSTYLVEGTPLIDPTLIKKGALPSSYIVAYCDKNKEQKIAYLSKDEYVKVKTAIKSGDAKNIEETLLRGTISE